MHKHFRCNKLTIQALTQNSIAIRLKGPGAMKGPVKFFVFDNVECKVQANVDPNTKSPKFFWEMRYFHRCMRSHTQSQNQQVRRAAIDMAAHGVPQSQVMYHFWQSRISQIMTIHKRTRADQRSAQGSIGNSVEDQPGMDIHVDATGCRAQGAEGCMTGATGEGNKAQLQVADELSIRTRALVTLLVLSIRCNRQTERQMKANQVLISIIRNTIDDIDDVDEDLQILVKKTWGKKAQ